MASKPKIRKRVERICLACGITFMGRADSLGTTCSRRCRSVRSGRSGLGKSKNAGKKNGNYKGDNALTPRRVLDAITRWRLRNKDKRRAEDIATLAIRNGQLIRQPCSVCGATGNIHGHHEDYSKPLEVVWLCPRHHRLRHKEIREASRHD